MIKKYKKKPIPIEAAQWDGTPDSLTEIILWAKKYNTTIKYIKLINAPAALIVETLEGEMKALIGDYIIRGVKNEFYPCREDIFKETYDEWTDPNGS